VSVHGEIWRAVTDGEALDDGAPVRVVDVRGLTLKVVKAGEGGV
jgi:membrane-bound ClpP family serine protease